MRSIAFKNILAAAVLTVTTGMSVNTTADEGGETAMEVSSSPTRIVQYTHADLSNAGGRDHVERRIRLAAEIVCGKTDRSASNNLNLHAIARNDSCYERAVDEAMAQLETGRIASIE